MDGVLQKLGLQEGEAITHPWINKALEKAQQKVEARNFDSRKYVLKYDDVMNDQRKVIFEQRIDIMGHDDVSETVADMRAQVVNELVAQCIRPMPMPSSGIPPRSRSEIERIFDIKVPVGRVGRRGGHRRPGDHRAAARADRGQGQAEGSRVRLRGDAADREDGAAADPRPPLARAPGRAGAPAQRHRLPQLRSARPAQRVQVGKLPAVRDHARQHARSRSPASSCTSSAMPGRARICSSRSELPPMQAHHADPFTGQDELAMADAVLAAGARPDPADGRAGTAERRCRPGGPLPASTRRTPPHGARSRATPPVRAARAGNTSIATASTTDACRRARSVGRGRAFLTETAAMLTQTVQLRTRNFPLRDVANSTSHWQAGL